MLNYNTFAFYQALRHSNPFLYYSIAIQKEMHDSYLVLGSKFFQIDEVASG